jgi:hypothetical protein
LGVYKGWLIGIELLVVNDRFFDDRVLSVLVLLKPLVVVHHHQVWIADVRFCLGQFLFFRGVTFQIYHTLVVSVVGR